MGEVKTHKAAPIVEKASAILATLAFGFLVFAIWDASNTYYVDEVTQKVHLKETRELTEKAGGAPVTPTP